ncbi:MAG: hypothetical protein C4547_06230 [Phycisphaerales bacterium]|nr:MAG: hypothetical protein C4547_06230 [Phycisphaerales bacterium]
MNPVDGISSPFLKYVAVHPASVPPPAAPIADRVDIVEISQEGRARAQSRIPARPEFTRILEIRRAIEEGTYETPERIEGTVDQILRILG